MDSNGEYRYNSAFTARNNQSLHYFVDPELISNRCTGLIDYYNTVVQSIDASNSENFFKLAAHLAFNFFDTHPFSDVNGRMCRMLTNHVLSFTFDNKTRCRDVYIEAIERYSESRHPKDLTFFLIENAYQSCVDFVNSFDDQRGGLVC